MKYIAVLDYNHLDNGIFLTAVARALAEYQQNMPSPILVVHGESEYTERLIQTGIMRKEATIRAIKDLNHRLVALFADEGVSAIGLNGYQRECITMENEELFANKKYFASLPSGPVLLLSNLVLNRETNQPTPVPLAQYIEFLQQQFAAQEVFLFSKHDHKSPIKAEVTGNNEQSAPDDLAQLGIPAQVTTASKFHKQINQES